MKRGTPRHKKMHALASALGIRLYSAVGIMEMLWHYTGQHTPEGDIGSVPDAEIASAVSWEKKPEKLVSALVDSNWVNRHEKYRLYVHDWPDHCEQSVRKWLDRNRKKFLPVYGQSTDSVRTNDGQLPDVVQASRGLGLAGLGLNILVSSEKEKKDAVFENSALAVLEEARPLYRSAGVPIPERHEQLCLQLIVGIPEARRPRILAYVRHMLASGRWSSAATTKAFKQLLNDGDWDVEITERTLPRVARDNGKSRGMTASDIANL